MRFKPGDLVKIISSISSSVHYEPPALILKSYIAAPKIFLHNEKMNKQWLEEEDMSEGRVYDISYLGKIEEAVAEEWLSAWDNVCDE